MRILVVDDYEDAASVLATLLEVAGHHTCCAHDGAAALRLGREFLPQAALLDLAMPRMSGYDLARAIRDEPWGSGVLLIALSGWGRPEDRRRAQEAGFHHHLIKPVELAALEEILLNAALQSSKP